MQERQPFISIVTRTFGGRPNLYARHLKSLEEQTFTDFEHIVIQNRKLDVLDANRSLYRERNRVNGRYVMILDDDDRLAAPDTLERIHAAASDSAMIPACIMVRMRRPDRIVPDDGHWGKPPVGGHVGSPCFIVDSTLWKEHIHHFGRASRGDFHFLTAIWKYVDWRTVWLDIIAADIMVVSHGAPEVLQ